MKILIRCFVAALAITGAIATTSANGSSVKTTVVATKTSAAPPANCDPRGNDDCGLSDNW
ncbi:MAG TPA: hypothetical protein VGU23_07975 [Acidobacteriaceae bacterium]|nr:hypothetical protein [Acidobacteriaceae bacterium]